MDGGPLAGHVGTKGRRCSRWTRWVGVGASAALGVAVLFGEVGLAENPLHRVLGWVLVGYAGVRVLVNIWLAHTERERKQGML